MADPAPSPGPPGGDGTATDLRATGDRIEALFERVRATADPRTVDDVEELLRLVTELYGAGLARVVDILRVEAPEVLTVLVEDELLGSLMIVHDLHPTDLAGRLGAALDSVRPFLHSHGGDVELLDVDEAAGAVHLRLLGSCDGCPSSAVTLRMEVERAIGEMAPEIVTIDVEEPAEVGVMSPVTLGRKPEVSPR